MHECMGLRLSKTQALTKESDASSPVLLGRGDEVERCRGERGGGKGGGGERCSIVSTVHIHTHTHVYLTSYLICTWM